MGLIIIKESGADAELFIKVINSANKILTNSDFGMATVKKGSCVIINRAKSLDKIYTLPGINFIRDIDTSVVTFSFPYDDGKGFINRDLPVAFSYNNNKLDFSTIGDLFIATAHKANYYFDEGVGKSFDQYVTDIVSDSKFLRCMEKGDFHTICKSGDFPLSLSSRAVYGNADGIYINSEFNFSKDRGILFSVPFIGKRIMNSLKDKNSYSPVKKVVNFKNTYHRTKEEYMARADELFFIQRFYVDASPFENREKFVIITSLNRDTLDDSFNLMSLDTGEIREVRYFVLNNSYDSFNIKSLHNGTSN